MPPPSSLPEYRACPHCAEPILVEARLCKHCHRSVPPVSKREPPVVKSKHRYLKAAGGTLFAFVAWFVYYEAAWTPSAPTTKAEIERPAGTAIDIQPQTPGASPKLLAKTYVANINKETIAVRELTMLNRLRTINTAEVTYKVVNSTLAPSLETLSQAGLIDPKFAKGVLDGYAFTWQLGASGSDYRLSARPLVYSLNGIASCITNETNAIHCTNEDREATFSDPIR